MREVKPQLEYQDAYHDGEQRWVVVDGADGFDGKVCLAVGRSHQAACRKALRALHRLANEIREQMDGDV